jgi:DNA-binding NarL/FixJ family response regulator
VSVARAEEVLLGDQSNGRHGHHHGDAATSGRWHGLTARDVAVLRLLAEGQSTAGIADNLAYSESTIKNVIHDIVCHLGARNRAHAVAMAIRSGVI